MKILKINKKGEMGEGILWVFRILATVVVVAMMVLLMTGTIDKSLDLGDLRFYTYAERLLYSPNCFTYQYYTRSYPGVIDSSKFTEGSIKRCMEPSKNAIGARVTLFDNDNEKVIYYNQAYFEDILPLTFSNKFMIVKQRYFILIDDELRPGNMLIEIAWQK